ncbi:hypothetical protein B9Z55_011788 [Caenorhabditis nigoni]|uniref:Nuclear receptor domain-containing protein n=1 Tax=Caenorhabditis nigoni TaxID=1611254 RepID=A0A2G5ULR1_9PELO|nr:hypothetical protein B9Z55_011788 [Caenorhabditis nigoni]
MIDNCRVCNRWGHLFFQFQVHCCSHCYRSFHRACLFMSRPCPHNNACFELGLRFKCRGCRFRRCWNAGMRPDPAMFDGDAITNRRRG